MRQLLILTAFAMCFASGVLAQTPTPMSSVPAANPALNGSAVTADEKGKLTKAFTKALSDEDKALNHQERSQLRELSAAQASRQRSWRENERKARKAFFDSHPSGPDRRDYVQGYLKRKLAFDNGQKSEIAEARKAWKDKEDALKKDQKDRTEKFKAQLGQNQHPDASLWPQAH